MKISEILLRFEYTIYRALKPNWTPSTVWIEKLTKFEQIDGTPNKDILRKYFGFY